MASFSLAVALQSTIGWHVGVILDEGVIKASILLKLVTVHVFDSVAINRLELPSLKDLLNTQVIDKCERE